MPNNIDIEQQIDVWQQIINDAAAEAPVQVRPFAGLRPGIVFLDEAVAPPAAPVVTKNREPYNTPENWDKILEGFYEVFGQHAEIAGSSIRNHKMLKKDWGIYVNAPNTVKQADFLKTWIELGWGKDVGAATDAYGHPLVCVSAKDGRKTYVRFGKSSPVFEADRCSYDLERGLVATEEAKKEWESKVLTFAEEFPAEKKEAYLKKWVKEFEKEGVKIAKKEWWKK